MKTGFFLLLLVVCTGPTRAQKPVYYTVWADGLANPQLAKSSFYLLGTGVRGEFSKSLRASRNRLFTQVGYARFFQKATSAFTANIGLVTVGYRYQSRRAFNASVGVGVQYWSERMRVHFPDYAINETLNSLMPSATVALGVRINPRVGLALEYQGLFKPESGSIMLRNTVVLSLGYTF